MNRVVRETLNDGYLQYGHRKTVRTDGKRTGTTFEAEGKLAFKEISIREEDYQVANLNTTTLSLKLKTLYPPFFRNIRKNKLKVLIDRVEYDVLKVDPDYGKNFLYFYLQEVGEYNE